MHISLCAKDSPVIFLSSSCAPRTSTNIITLTVPSALPLELLVSFKFLKLMIPPPRLISNTVVFWFFFAHMTYYLRIPNFLLLLTPGLEVHPTGKPTSERRGEFCTYTSCQLQELRGQLKDRGNGGEGEANKRGNIHIPSENGWRLSRNSVTTSNHSF